MQQFFDYLDLFCPLSFEGKQAIEKASVIQSMPKGTIVVEEGKVCHYLYFLKKGAVRGFHNLDGKEVTYWFAFENTFATSLYSFISRKPALETICFMEDSEVVILHYDDLQKLYKTHPEIEHLGRLLDEHYYVMLEERMFSYMFRTAKERYENLVKTTPHILQRMPLGHIASYLGISQETLSRIRNKS